VHTVNVGLAVLLLISFAVALVQYFFLRKQRRETRIRQQQIRQEQEIFMKTFNDPPFDDFSAFDFWSGRLSFVAPFPRLVENEWRYIISLSASDVEDFVTIAHELSECTIGRVIERLLELEKPLYLLRKEDDKFWIHGKQQKYLVEHVMATLGEVDSLIHERLRERLGKEELKEWLNLTL